MKDERSVPLSFQFKEGYHAFDKGWLVNKYDAESNKGKEWQRGFDAAYFDNVERHAKMM